MQISNLFRRNWRAMFYFNFKMLPIKQAIKFPFDFYGPIHFENLSGKIEVPPNIQRGCFQFGRCEREIFPSSKMIISIKGILRFNGFPFNLGTGSTVEIGEYAILETGEDILIAPHYRIILKKGAKIGNHIRISWEGQMFDSNFHYMRNVTTGNISHISKEIVIGNNCWIGNRVTVNKSTQLPNFTIVAAGSLTNKDYTKDGKTHLTLAGCPAKIVAEGYERIFETMEEELCISLNEREYRENP